MRLRGLFLCTALIVTQSAFSRTIPPGSQPSCEDLVRSKRYVEAKEHAQALARFALASEAAASDVRVVLAMAAACRSLAFAGLGDERSAAWDWYVATSLDSTVTVDWDETFPIARKFSRAMTSNDGDAPPHKTSEPVVAPLAVNKIQPEYPPRARALNLTQTVEIEFVVDIAGLTSKPRLVSTDVDPALAFVAFDATRQWTFRPATLKGNPVKAIYNLKVKFKRPPA